MQYRLRTLLILMAIGPPLVAGVWIAWPKAIERHRQWQFDQLVELIETTIVPES